MLRIPNDAVGISLTEREGAGGSPSSFGRPHRYSKSREKITCCKQRGLRNMVRSSFYKAGVAKEHFVSDKYAKGSMETRH